MLSKPELTLSVVAERVGRRTPARLAPDITSDIRHLPECVLLAGYGLDPATLAAPASGLADPGGAPPPLLSRVARRAPTSGALGILDELDDVLAALRRTAR